MTAQPTVLSPPLHSHWLSLPAPIPRPQPASRPPGDAESSAHAPRGGARPLRAGRGPREPDRGASLRGSCVLRRAQPLRSGAGAGPKRPLRRLPALIPPPPRAPPPPPAPPPRRAALGLPPRSVSRRPRPLAPLARGRERDQRVLLVGGAGLRASGISGPLGPAGEGAPLGGPCIRRRPPPASRWISGRTACSATWRTCRNSPSSRGRSAGASRCAGPRDAPLRAVRPTRRRPTAPVAVSPQPPQSLTLCRSRGSACPCPLD